MVNVVKEFNYKGYACDIKKIDYTDENIEGLFSSKEDYSMRKWWYCGYVFLPNFKVELKDDINNIMHGGITYEYEYEGTTVLGFDCNHATDTDEHNTIEFVENNLKAVIDFIEKEQENGKSDVKYKNDND